MSASSPVIAALVVAAGTGERMTDGSPLPKQYRPIAGVAVLTRAVRAMLAHPDIAYVLPVIHASHQELFASLALREERLLAPVEGAETRQASVLAGLRALAHRRPDLVLIQDAARPFTERGVIDRVLRALESECAVVPVTPISDTIKRAEDGHTVSGTEDRSKLFAAQTPQGFRFEEILGAHQRASLAGRHFTDDAGIAEWAGLSVVLAPGDPRNLKITLPEDFQRAERMFEEDRRLTEMRVGTGFDVHPFEPGEAVWLGGVRIPHSQRLKGHSDADVALHALTDALYGALGEGDIGTHFPPGDPQWRGAASTRFLAHAAGLVGERGGRVVNLDVTIVCEAPRVAPHVPAMREIIAATCGCAPSRVTIKATTSEGLGFTGRGEGIVAMASASIELPRSE